MTKITCYDVFGKAYVVDESELLKRTSVYGIYIKEGKVLLIKDKIAKQWEVPGGGVEDGEEEIDSLLREIQEETGLTIATDVEFITQRQEYFYGLYQNQAVDSLRKFYLIKNIVSGEVLPSGNGWDTIATKYVPLDEVDTFTPQEMKKIYREIINQAVELSKRTF